MTEQTKAEWLAMQIAGRSDNAIIYGDSAAAELRRLSPMEQELSDSNEAYALLFNENAKLRAEINSLNGLVFAAEQSANNGSLYWEVEDALTEYNTFRLHGCFMHKPSGFTFEEVVSSVDQSDLLSLTKPATTAQELERLRAECEALRKDAERLDWVIFYSARVTHSKDGEACSVWWFDDNEEHRSKPFGNAREAINAAMGEKHV